MAVLKGFTKQAVERKLYTLDYSCWMEEGELLADYSILVTPATPPNPLVADGAYVDPTFKLISTFLSGGAAGYVYTVRFVATTSTGQVKSDDIQLRVL